MIIDDLALSRFALGVASASGVLLAVFASLFVFLIHRWASDMGDALGMIKASANEIYQTVFRSHSVAERYFDDAPSYAAVLKSIVRLTHARAIEDVPDFIEWRTSTSEIIRVVSDYISNLPRIGDSTSSSPGIDESLQEFHTSFTGQMFKLDDAIQLSDWTRIQRVMAQRTSFITILTGLTLVTSLMVSLSAEMEITSTLPDSWNLVPASLLLFIMLLIVVSLVLLTRFAWTTRQEWVGRLVTKLVKRGRLSEGRGYSIHNDQQLSNSEVPMPEKEDVLQRDETFENAGVGYLAAVSQIIHSSSNTWNRFNAMVVANGVIVATIVFLISSQKPLQLATYLLALSGVILCVVWIVFLNRGLDHVAYYICSARRFEMIHFSETVTPLLKSNVLRESDMSDGMKRGLRRRLQSRASAYVVLGIFIGL